MANGRPRELREGEITKRIVQARFETHWTAKTGYYFTNPRLTLEDGTVLTFEAKERGTTPVKLIVSYPGREGGP